MKAPRTRALPRNGDAARSAPVPANEDQASPRGRASAAALIDATSRLLAENVGFDVSLAEIAKRSGLNSALIRYYFGNKTGLLLAVLERDARLSMTGLEQLIAMDLPAEQKLRIHISGIINAYFRSPYVNRLIHYMFESGNVATAERVATVYVQPMLRAYARIIDQGVAAGTMRPIEPAMLYYSLVGAADHIFHARYALRTTVGQEVLTEEIKQRYLETVTGVFLRGLAV